MSKTENDRASSQKRHEAQCSICSSPYREDFEESFVNWSDPIDWRSLYKFGKYSVYRHAHQFGLFERRRENLSMALEKIVERMDWAALTGGNGIAAIKMLLELEEKRHKKGRADLANTPVSSKSKMAKSEDPDGGLPEVVPAVEATDSDEVRETESCRGEAGIKPFLPAVEAIDTADVVEPGDPVPNEGFPPALTPAIETEEHRDVPVAEPAPEPVEI